MTRDLWHITTPDLSDELLRQELKCIVLSRSLLVTVINVAILGVAIVVLRAGVLQQPWDLIALGLVAIICPIGGVWLALSIARREIRNGTRRAQPVAAIAISLLVLVAGLLLLASVRP